MSKRRRGKRVDVHGDGNSFGDHDHLLESLGLQGDIGPYGTGSTNAAIETVGIPIDMIHPDHVQPRRAMPETLRSHWCNGAPIEGVFIEWASQAARELGFSEEEARDYWLSVIEVDDNDEPLESRDIPPDIALKSVARQWISLLRLASSIWFVGLEQPVTLYQDEEDGYRLLVGERRLLSFHLLMWLGYQQFSHIPAVLRDRYSPFNQAFENGARKNLNAISTARQLAIVLMELHGYEVHPGHGQVGQKWYAEALALHIPKGKADAVALMMGLPSVRTVQLYKKLLTLPEVVWQWADEYDWPEGKLRGWMSKAKGKDDQLIAFAKAEYEREIGIDKKQVITPQGKVVRRAERTSEAMRRITSMDDEMLKLLPDHQRDEMKKLARAILKVLGK